MSYIKHLAAGAALSTLMFASGSAAFAQSTGTAAVEELVVSGTSGPRNIAGFALSEAPKAQVSLTQDYIATQSPGQTVLATINQLPGVNFTNNDAFGSAGGDVTIRGFDSARIALLEDGIPLNDTGNYAIYPSQQLDSELISLVTVNLGTTDVDSPTAAAAGGTINYNTLKPSTDFGGYIKASAGSQAYRRVFGLVNTGEIGPWGTTGWLSSSYTRNDIFTGPGKIEKFQINGRLYQDLGSGSFVSLIAHYNINRNNFIRRISLAQFNAGTILGYEPSCNTLPAEVNPGPGAQVDAACSNFYGNNINPSNTGNMRGQGNFRLSDSLRLTVDPYFQYTIANGGGRQAFSETDPQLARGGAGVDMNRDGDLLDTVLLYAPNTTNTRRYGVTSSLIWNINASSNFRIAYTYDKGRHRQTGEFTTFDAAGYATNVFGGKDGYGQPIRLPDGSILRKRDRVSLAQLQQISAEYRARFLQDRLLVNVGVRAPFFHRELQNFCYQRDTFNAYCTTQTPAVNAQGLLTFPTSGFNPANSVYGAPRSFERDYDKVLPNIGAAWQFNDANQLYAAYAETISAPRTDDLYDQKLVNPQPETTKTVSIGYRLQMSNVSLDAGIYQTKFDNRISRTYDEAAQLFSSINVGRVDYEGADIGVVWQPATNLTLRGSASYIKTEIKKDLPNGIVNGLPVFLATQGKRVPEIPETQYGFGAAYKVAGFDLGIQGKWVDERWTNEVNTEKAPAYTLWDANIEYDLARVGLPEGSALQLNVSNLFDESWLGDISTNPTGTALFQPGYPRAVTLTLKGAF